MKQPGKAAWKDAAALLISAVAVGLHSLFFFSFEMPRMAILFFAAGIIMLLLGLVLLFRVTPPTIEIVSTDTTKEAA